MANKHVVTLIEHDEESFDIAVDGRHIVHACHDIDGWEGMRKVEQLEIEMARAFGAKFERRQADE